MVAREVHKYLQSALGGWALLMAVAQRVDGSGKEQMEMETVEGCEVMRVHSTLAEVRGVQIPFTSFAVLCKGKQHGRVNVDVRTLRPGAGRKAPLSGFVNAIAP